MRDRGRERRAEPRTVSWDAGRGSPQVSGGGRKEEGLGLRALGFWGFLLYAIATLWVDPQNSTGFLGAKHRSGREKRAGGQGVFRSFGRQNDSCRFLLTIRNKNTFLMVTSNS